MRRFLIAATALVLCLPQPLAGQQATGCDNCELFTQIGAERLAAVFDTLHARFSRDLAQPSSSPVALPDSALDEVRSQVALRGENIQATLRSQTSKRAVEGGVPSLNTNLREYYQFIEYAYGDATGVPPYINEPWNLILGHFLSQLNLDLAEYDRRFFIRNGEMSERLNIVEMIVDQMLAPAPRGDTMNYPSPLEPIARVQVFGYQMDGDFGEIHPSKPTFQVGATYYLFCESRFCQTVNHIGGAAAFQRDWTFDRSLAGLVLHVRNVDVGWLCNVEDICDDWSLAASVNFALLEPVWSGMRRRMAD